MTEKTGNFDAFSLIKELSECFAPSGCEDEMRELIYSKLSSLCDETTLHRDGSVTGRIYGRCREGAPVLLCAHMDEVGFMIKAHSEDGTMSLSPLGIDDPARLAGKRIKLKSHSGELISGYIGVVPVHLTKGSAAPSYDNLYADIGATSRAEAESVVPKGSFGTLHIKAERLGGDFVKCKALSSRAACAALLTAASLLREEHRLPERDVVLAFTCRGELGISGVTAAVRREAPGTVYVISGEEQRTLPCEDGTLSLEGGLIICPANPTSPADKAAAEAFIRRAHSVGLATQTGLAPTPEAKRAAAAGVCASVSVAIPTQGNVMSLKNGY